MKTVGVFSLSGNLHPNPGFLSQYLVLFLRLISYHE
jgi:hypothetical protein